MEISTWKAGLEMEREEKDRFFAEHGQSPIPSEDRLRFRGLAYYPPDPAYRFELELHEHPKKETLTMEMSQGSARKFLRWGEFRFNIGGEECTLQAYKGASEEERLFLPFRDATSGTETYGAGRYLDLDSDRDRTPEGKWILDLNKAYNPWCAYSEAYTCPFVPSENWLKKPVQAGEKTYTLHKE